MIGVKCAGGFVAQQRLGLCGQSAGNGNALALAAAQLGRKCLGLIRQAHKLQQLHGALFSLYLGHTVQLHGEADVFQAVALHQQIELLKDHGDLAAGRTQLGRCERCHIAAVYQHLAGGGAFQHIDAAHQSGFARTGHADDAINCAIFNGEVDILQCMHLTTVYGKAFG